MTGQKLSALDHTPVGEAWEDLVSAMLAVGGFSVGKIVEIRGGLRDAGLMDPKNLARWDAGRVTRELNSAGYSRGLLTGMYAERLVATFRALAHQIDQGETILESGEPDQIAELLLPLHGVGPTVVKTFLELRSRRAVPHKDGSDG